MKGYDPATGLGYIQNGLYVEVKLPYARKGGEGVMVGSLFGVCVVDGAQNDVVNIHTEGVYGLTAASGANTNATAGAPAYWDDSNKRITSIVGSPALPQVGVFLSDKTTSQAFATVRLD